jgi:hypothetical protein
MPLRLLQYQARIWERNAADHPSHPRLPPILTVLLFQGPALAVADPFLPRAGAR